MRKCYFPGKDEGGWNTFSKAFYFYYLSEGGGFAILGNGMPEGGGDNCPFNPPVHLSTQLCHTSSYPPCMIHHSLGLFGGVLHDISFIVAMWFSNQYDATTLVMDAHLIIWLKVDLYQFAICELRIKCIIFAVKPTLWKSRPDSISL